MYEEWGGAPAAGVVTVIGSVHGRRVMVVANDATVKAGACFPMTIKKILRAQAIAATNRLPLVYLVDSSGVFLPMQDEVFPDDDDFGRIFRNNAVLSAQGIPQYAAIMGNCVAGGAYLPVLCDTVLMTEGSGLYLAGPALVKAAIGQDISHEELGGAHVHAAISGTIDYREPDDDACLARLRRLIALLPPDPAPRVDATAIEPPPRPEEDLYRVVRTDPSAQYDVRDLLACVLDGGRLDEYRAEYGRTLVCGFGHLGGMPLGVVASQRLRFRPEGRPVPVRRRDLRRQRRQGRAVRARVQPEPAADPLHPGRQRLRRRPRRRAQRHHPPRGQAGQRRQQQHGAQDHADRRPLLRRGALCPLRQGVRPALPLRLAGGALRRDGCPAGGPDHARRQRGDPQATGKSDRRRRARPIADELRQRYDRETDIRYAAARLWIDAIIDPARTREVLIQALDVATRCRDTPITTGVFQV